MLKSTPKLKDLSELVTPDYATKWKAIGQLLGLKKSDLDIIEYDHGQSVVQSCTEMWVKWLSTHTDATWEKVLNSLEHRNVTETGNLVDSDTTKCMFAK